MSNAVHASLDWSLLNPVYVKYPASYGSPSPYVDSRDGGKANLLQAAVARFPDPVYVGGYSQGAWGAGQLAKECAAGLHPNINLQGVALLADPLRPRHRQPVQGPSIGYGISGERDITGVPAWWAAVHDDPITSMLAGNPARSIPDLTLYYSIDSLAAAHRWADAMLRAILAGQLQPWWNPEHWRDWGGAFDALLNYALRGRHTTAYIDEGHTAALAEAVNAHAAAA
jgi:hypothetical protein